MTELEYEKQLGLKDMEIKDKEVRISDLEAQIEKMKCWCNCQNWKNCLFECAEKGKKFEKEFCFGCPKWQLDVKKLEKVRRK